MAGLHDIEALSFSDGSVELAAPFAGRGVAESDDGDYAFTLTPHDLIAGSGYEWWLSHNGHDGWTF